MESLLRNKAATIATRIAAITICVANVSQKPQFAAEPMSHQSNDDSGAESGQDAVYFHAVIEPLGNALAALPRQCHDA